MRIRTILKLDRSVANPEPIGGGGRPIHLRVHTRQPPELQGILEKRGTQMSTLMRKVLNRGGPKYIQVADRIISKVVGGENSPAFYDVEKM